MIPAPGRLFEALIAVIVTRARTRSPARTGLTSRSSSIPRPTMGAMSKNPDWWTSFWLIARVWMADADSPPANDAFATSSSMW